MRRITTPYGALALTAVPTLGLVLFDPRPGAIAVIGGIGLSTLGLIRFRDLERAGRTVPTLAVWIAGLVVIGAAVIVAPRSSGDVWSYVMYGRIASIHHANPWVVVPAHFHHDRFLRLVSRGWRHTTSIYGPGFVAIAAVLTKIAGSSAFAARTLMKSVFALATVAAGLLVTRRTRSAAATAIVLLHPAIVVSGIAGGHNDILVGLAVLGAVMLAIDDRPLAAGVVAALGASVKFTGGIAILVIAVWAITVHGPKWALRFATTAGGGLALAYLPIGMSGLSAVRQNDDFLSRASPWQIPRLLLGTDPTHRIIDLGLSRTLVPTLVTIGTLVTGALIVWVAIRFRNHLTPTAGIIAAMLVFVVFAPYALPWYEIWVIPVVALAPCTSLGRLAIVQAATIVLVYELEFQHVPPAITTLVWWATLAVAATWGVMLIRRIRAAGPLVTPNSASQLSAFATPPAAG